MGPSKWSRRILSRTSRLRYRIRREFPQTSRGLSSQGSSWKMVGRSRTTTSRRSKGLPLLLRGHPLQVHPLLLPLQGPPQGFPLHRPPPHNRIRPHHSSSRHRSNILHCNCHPPLWQQLHLPLLQEVSLRRPKRLWPGEGRTQEICPSCE